MRRLHILGLLLSAGAVLSILLTGSPRASNDPNPEPGWPPSINIDNGFHTLGLAMRRDPGCPSKGSDIDRARYVASQIPKIVERYKLHTGGGGVFDNALIGIGRLMAGVVYNDPENTAPLNTVIGLGDCSEWSYAMCEILSGAGAGQPYVAFADHDPAQDYSLTFTGTDTMVVIKEYSPSKRRYSRRVFDAFQAVYNSEGNIPQPGMVSSWTDLPLADCDRWADEKGGDTWLKAIKKPYVKDAITLLQLDAPLDPKVTPTLEKRPPPFRDTPISQGSIWTLQETFVYPAQPFDSGPTWNRGMMTDVSGFSLVDWYRDPNTGVEKNWVFNVSFDAPPEQLESSKNFKLKIYASAAIPAHADGAFFPVWGSYEGDGIGCSAPETPVVGVNIEGQDIPSASSETEFFVTDTMPDTVIIYLNSHKGHIVRFTYKSSR